MSAKKKSPGSAGGPPAVSSGPLETGVSGFQGGPVRGAARKDADSAPSSIIHPRPLRVRAGQLEFERGVDLHRVCGLIARRQYGKTTIASRIALKKMMRTPGHTVVFGSVKLDLGREIVRKESEALQKAIKQLVGFAQSSAGLLDLTDERGKALPATLGADDFAELYEAQRLEFRFHHDRTTYSRTKVVALTTSAVGETGDLILDEVGRVKNFREVWEAVSPIIASNPQFRCLLTTTPPPQDDHYSFELLAPPITANFAPNPKGNWYRSDLGVHTLRVDAWDAYADNVPLYDDDTGAPISPEQSRAVAADKDAWDRNYGCKFVLGGTAAIGLLQLDAAQRRGVGKCACFRIDSDADLETALEFLANHLGEGPVGLGLDLATTEQKTSNPTALTVGERSGAEVIFPVTFYWKTAEPSIARGRVRRIVEAVNARPNGGRARRLCIDATNERLFSRELQSELGALVPVELVVGSETVDQPGGESITKKALLGNKLVGLLDDNLATVAPDRYTKDDLRRVKRDRGSFSCEVGPNGEHGDVFDGHKLALHALTSTDGAIESTAGIRIATPKYRPTFQRRRLS